MLDIIPQFLVFVMKGAGPGCVLVGGGGLDGGGEAIFLIELVGEFVDDDVVRGGVGVAGGEDVVPGEDDGAIGPGFAGTGFVGFGDDPAVGTLDTGGDEGVGIDQDGDDTGEVVGGTMEEKDAGLGGDGETDLVGDAESVAALEELFVEEDEEVGLELGTVGGRETAIEGDGLEEEADPVGRERATTDATTTPRTENRHCFESKDKARI